MACVTCPEQFTPEYEKLCGATNQPEEEPVYTEPPTEESVTVENETDDNSIEGIFSKIDQSVIYENRPKDKNGVIKPLKWSF